MLSAVAGDLEALGISIEVLGAAATGSRVGEGALHLDVAGHGRPWCAALRGELEAAGAPPQAAYGRRIALSELREAEVCACWFRDRSPLPILVRAVAPIAGRIRLGRDALAAGAQLQPPLSRAARGAVAAWVSRTPLRSLAQVAALEPGLVAELEARTAAIGEPGRGVEGALVVLVGGEARLGEVIQMRLGGALRESAEVVLGCVGRGATALGDHLLVEAEAGLEEACETLGIAAVEAGVGTGFAGLACGLWRDDPELSLGEILELTRACLAGA